MFRNRLPTLRDPLSTLKNVRQGIVAELTHLPVVVSNRRSPFHHRNNSITVATTSRNSSMCQTSLGFASDIDRGTVSPLSTYTASVDSSKMIWVNSTSEKMQAKSMNKYLNQKQYNNDLHDKLMYPT